MISDRLSLTARFPRPGRRLLLAVTALALVAGACSSGSSGGSSAATTVAPSQSVSSSALTRMRALHATRGTNARILDDQGRQVLLRGVNVNSLGDYFQANPQYATTLAVTDGDWATMAAQGFDVVRLLVSWSRLEPTKGKIDQAYLTSIHAAVADAAHHGIWSVIDMHQDAWGKYVASPPGTTCPTGTQPGIGWDGAPQWATITDGASTCAVGGIRELAPAVQHAFDHFYANTDGIQTELVNTWAAVAKSFAGDPAVAGYDLFNEPNAGTQVPTSGANLGAFYAKAVPAIRAAEQAGGGFSHIVFFEPVVFFPTPNTLPPASNVTDANLVFAPHNYHGSSDGGTVEQGFADDAAAAASYGTTMWIGEFGWFGDPAANAVHVTAFANAQDQALVGGTWWQWRQACGDPHSVGKRNGQPASQIVQYNLNGCPGDQNLGPVKEWAPILSRGYPRSAPGRLTSLRSDGVAGTLSVSGDATQSSAGARLVVWIPGTGAQPKVGGQGISSLQWVKVTGGWLLSAGVCHSGYTLAVGAGAPALVSTCGAIDDDGNSAAP